MKKFIDDMLLPIVSKGILKELEKRWVMIQYLKSINQDKLGLEKQANRSIERDADTPAEE